MFGAFTGNVKDNFLNSRNLAQGISVEFPPFFSIRKATGKGTCPAKAVKKKKKIHFGDNETEELDKASRHRSRRRAR